MPRILSPAEVKLAGDIVDTLQKEFEVSERNHSDPTVTRLRLLASVCEVMENSPAPPDVPFVSAGPIPLPKTEDPLTGQLRHHIGNPLFALETSVSMLHGTPRTEEVAKASVEKIKQILYQLDKEKA